MPRRANKERGGERRRGEECNSKRSVQASCGQDALGKGTIKDKLDVLQRTTLIAATHAMHAAVAIGRSKKTRREEREREGRGERREKEEKEEREGGGEGGEQSRAEGQRGGKEETETEAPETESRRQTIPIEKAHGQGASITKYTAKVGPLGQQHRSGHERMEGIWK